MGSGADTDILIRFPDKSEISLEQDIVGSVSRGFDLK